ncbi:MAG: CagY family CD-EC repeat-containing protein [Halothiobacillaceae bacterium]
MSIKLATVLGGLLVLSLTLSGCGPVYSTQYRYTPPLDANGKMCVNQCVNNRDMCRMMEETRAMQEQAQCQQYAAMRYSMCLSNAKTEQERRNCERMNRGYCSRTAYTEHCEESFRLCFQNCGGKIDSFQVCDFGC